MQKPNKAVIVNYGSTVKLEVSFILELTIMRKQRQLQNANMTTSDATLNTKNEMFGTSTKTATAATGYSV